MKGRISEDRPENDSSTISKANALLLKERKQIHHLLHRFNSVVSRAEVQLLTVTETHERKLAEAAIDTKDGTDIRDDVASATRTSQSNNSVKRERWGALNSRSAATKLLLGWRAQHSSTLHYTDSGVDAVSNANTRSDKSGGNADTAVEPSSEKDTSINGADELERKESEQPQDAQQQSKNDDGEEGDNTTYSTPPEESPSSVDTKPKKDASQQRSSSRASHKEDGLGGKEGQGAAQAQAQNKPTHGDVLNEKEGVGTTVDGLTALIHAAEEILETVTHACTLMTNELVEQQKAKSENSISGGKATISRAGAEGRHLSSSSSIHVDGPHACSKDFELLQSRELSQRYFIQLSESQARNSIQRNALLWMLRGVSSGLLSGFVFIETPRELPPLAGQQQISELSPQGITSRNGIGEEQQQYRLSSTQRWWRRSSPSPSGSVNAPRTSSEPVASGVVPPARRSLSGPTVPQQMVIPLVQCELLPIGSPTKEEGEAPIIREPETLSVAAGATTTGTATDLSIGQGTIAEEQTVNFTWEILISSNIEGEKNDHYCLRIEREMKNILSKELSNDKEKTPLWSPSELDQCVKLFVDAVVESIRPGKGAEQDCGQMRSTAGASLLKLPEDHILLLHPASFVDAFIGSIRTLWGAAFSSQAEDEFSEKIIPQLLSKEEVPAKYSLPLGEKVDEEKEERGEEEGRQKRVEGKEVKHGDERKEKENDDSAFSTSSDDDSNVSSITLGSGAEAPVLGAQARAAARSSSDNRSKRKIASPGDSVLTTDGSHSQGGKEKKGQATTYALDETERDLLQQLHELKIDPDAPSEDIKRRRAALIEAWVEGTKKEERSNASLTSPRSATLETTLSHKESQKALLHRGESERKRKKKELKREQKNKRVLQELLAQGASPEEIELIVAEMSSKKRHHSKGGGGSPRHLSGSSHQLAPFEKDHRGSPRSHHRPPFHPTASPLQQQQETGPQSVQEQAKPPAPDTCEKEGSASKKVKGEEHHEEGDEKLAHSSTNLHPEKEEERRKVQSSEEETVEKNYAMPEGTGSAGATAPRKTPPPAPTPTRPFSKSSSQSIPNDTNNGNEDEEDEPANSRRSAPAPVAAVASLSPREPDRCYSSVEAQLCPSSHQVAPPLIGSVYTANDVAPVPAPYTPERRNPHIHSKDHDSHSGDRELASRYQQQQQQEGARVAAVHSSKQEVEDEAHTRSAAPFYQRPTQQQNSHTALQETHYRQSQERQEEEEEYRKEMDIGFDVVQTVEKILDEFVSHCEIAVIEEFSNAYRNGLRVGDRILAIDHAPIAVHEDFIDALDNLSHGKKGSKCFVTIERGSRMMIFKFVPEPPLVSQQSMPGPYSTLSPDSARAGTARGGGGGGANNDPQPHSPQPRKEGGSALSPGQQHHRNTSSFSSVTNQPSMSSQLQGALTKLQRMQQRSNCSFTTHDRSVPSVFAQPDIMVYSSPKRIHVDPHPLIVGRPTSLQKSPHPSPSSHALPRPKASTSYEHTTKKIATPVASPRGGTTDDVRATTNSYTSHPQNVRAGEDQRRDEADQAGKRFVEAKLQYSDLVRQIDKNLKEISDPHKSTPPPRQQQHYYEEGDHGRKALNFSEGQASRPSQLPPPVPFKPPLSSREEPAQGTTPRYAMRSPARDPIHPFLKDSSKDSRASSTSRSRTSSESVDRQGLNVRRDGGGVPATATRSGQRVPSASSPQVSRATPVGSRTSPRSGVSKSPSAKRSPMTHWR